MQDRTKIPESLDKLKERLMNEPSEISSDEADLMTIYFITEFGRSFAKSVAEVTTKQQERFVADNPVSWLWQTTHPRATTVAAIAGATISQLWATTAPPPLLLLTDGREIAKEAPKVEIDPNDRGDFETVEDCSDEVLNTTIKL